MGTRLAILTWLLVLALTVPVRAETPGCLNCHSAHSPERGACVSCHEGNPRSTRRTIAHHDFIPARFAYFTLADSPVTKRGRKRLEDTACQRCHVTGGKGNRLAADLDRSVQTSNPVELAEALREPVLFMPDFHFTEVQISEVVNALFAAGRGVAVPTGEMPRAVHFEVRDAAADNPFSKHCGGCHRTLTLSYGGLGTGEAGPNLSGLLTSFYPPTYKGKDAWTPETLKKWLDNPRQSRPEALMPPVPLKDEEFRRVLKILQEKISVQK